MLSFIGSSGLVSFLGRGLNPLLLFLLMVVVMLMLSRSCFFIFYFYCFVYESLMLLRVFDVGGGISYFP